MLLSEAAAAAAHAGKELPTASEGSVGRVGRAELSVCEARCRFECHSWLLWAELGCQKREDGHRVSERHPRRLASRAPKKSSPSWAARPPTRTELAGCSASRTDERRGLTEQPVSRRTLPPPPPHPRALRSLCLPLPSAGGGAGVEELCAVGAAAACCASGSR